MLQNLSLIQQATWRVWLVHLAAKLFGVLAHVEGIPIGSNRITRRNPWRGESSFAGDGGTVIISNI